MAAQIAGMAQLATVAVLLGGEKIFSLIGMAQPPAWYHVVAENKIMTFGTVWFANSLANKLIATGAFEIFLDDQPVYSKLETGRLPTIRDIVTGFQQYGLDMKGPSQQLAEQQVEDDHEF